MPGYPRVVGYVAGEEAYQPGLGVYGQPPPPAPPMLPVRGGHPYGGHHHHHQHHEGGVYGHPIHSPPWRAMNAPGSPPLGEGHVPLPMNAETFGGQWGNGQAGTGATIIFSARPQKPYKTARVIVRGTKVGTTAVGNLVGQIFVGTDLQQGELGNIDLESIGAATAFDTWLSLKQAEPGVWIRAMCTLTAFPSGTDYEVYTISAIGHYLH
jgi:hypothetical protein